MSSTGVVLTLDDVFTAVRRRWRMIVVISAISVALAGALGFLWPDRYAATTIITVEPIAVIANAGSANTVNMETERVVAVSSAVLAPASEQLGDVSVATLRDAVQVSVPKGSQVLEFTATLPDPEQAADAANAVAESYRAQRIANAERVTGEAADRVMDQLTSLETERRLQVEQGGSAASIEVVQLQIEALQQSLAALTSLTFNPGSTVTEATPPRDSASPSIVVFLAAGLVLGLLVGMFATIVSARRAHAVRHAHARVPATVSTSSSNARKPRQKSAPTPRAKSTR